MDLHQKGGITPTYFGGTLPFMGIGGFQTLERLKYEG